MAMDAQMKVEKYIRSRLVPIHPQIHAGCGLALRTPIEYEGRLKELIDQESISYQESYILDFKENSRKTLVIKYDLSR